MSMAMFLAKAKAPMTEAEKQHTKPPPSSLNVAIQGCCHGELDRIYSECEAYERRTKTKLDLLICCGDFQSVRDDKDLSNMAVPDKYRVSGDFPAYFRGEKKAPVFTIFVGGNHEASNYLWEHYDGGYVAENIFYLGHSSVVDFKGLRIAGLSGIYKRMDYDAPYPVPPYTSGQIRSAYHVRRFEVEKLKLIPVVDPALKIDVVVSHDWPVGITTHGDEAQLIRYKPFFEEDIRHNVLGNPHTMALLEELKPRHWFAAHLHCYFTASVKHKEGSTEFLALDKCAKGSGFLEFKKITVEDRHDRFEVHSAWKKISAATAHMRPVGAPFTAESIPRLRNAVLNPAPTQTEKPPATAPTAKDGSDSEELWCEDV